MAAALQHDSTAQCLGIPAPGPSRRGKSVRPLRLDLSKPTVLVSCDVPGRPRSLTALVEDMYPKCFVVFVGLGVEFASWARNAMRNNMRPPYRLPSSLCVVIATMVASAGNTCWAQLAMPDKAEYKLAAGSSIHGKAYAFGYQMCFLQRRLGKLYLNGQEIDDPTSSMLLEKLCAEYNVPLSDKKSMQKLLAGQQFAQLVLPYYTLRYHNQNGSDQQMAIVLLAPAEIQELRPVFELWLAEQQREQEGRLKEARDFQNKNVMLAMQAEALNVQRAIAREARAGADALKEIAREAKAGVDALKEIDRKTK